MSQEKRKSGSQSGKRGPYKPRAVQTAYTKRVRLPVALCDEIERRGGLKEVLILALQIGAPQAAEKN
jgi:hypothetical protein